MTAELLKGALYGRNSQAEEKSIDDQLREGHDDAAEAGIKIVAEYSDGKSASWYATGVRDDWTKVMADVEKKAWDVLCLWEASRGSRSPEDWSKLIRRCREQGILIRIIRDGRNFDPRNDADLKSLLQDGVDSLMESIRTSARVRKGIRGAVAKGTPLGRETFGYERTRDKRGKVTGQVPDENAATVREVFRMLADGVPASRIVRTLNEKGVTSPGKGAWTNTHIRALGRNRAYIAQRKDPSGEWVQGSWEPIVDESVFWAVQRILDTRAQADAEGKRGREGRIVWLMSGIGTCGECGAGVSGNGSRAMYLCPKGHVAIKASDLDGYVTAVVLGLLARPDVYSGLRQAGQESDAEIVAARTEVARLKAKLEDAKAAWAADRLDLADYEDMAGRIKPLIKAAEEKVQRAVVPPSVRGLVEPGVDVAKRWAAMPLAARRDVIRALMVVKVNRSQMIDGGWLEVEDRVEIDPR